MRSRNLILLFMLMTAFRGIAQSPDDGNVVGKSYVNSYFHFSYSWPTFLNPYDTRSLNLPPHSPYANEFLLFSARQENEPYGIVVLAERLNAVTPHSRGIRDGADFIDRVTRFNPEQHAVILSRKHFTNAADLVYDQLDYTENGAPSSAIAVQIGKFLIIFKCNAKSAADLAEINKSVIALRIVK